MKTLASAETKREYSFHGNTLAAVLVAGRHSPTFYLLEKCPCTKVPFELAGVKTVTNPPAFGYEGLTEALTDIDACEFDLSE